MGSFGGYYKGDKKKKKKSDMENDAMHIQRIYTPPKVEIISKGKKEK